MEKKKNGDQAWEREEQQNRLKLIKNRSIEQN